MASILGQPALVLNRNWQPVHVASVRRVLTLLFAGAARVVDPQSYQLYTWDDWAALEPADDEPGIRSVSRRFRAPEVITLVAFDRLPQGRVTFSKRNVFKRDRFTCQYCGEQPTREETTLDHVLPKSKGGASSWENCVLACVDCNHRKADRTPEQARMKLRSEPTRPTWKPTFSGPVRQPNWSNFLGQDRTAVA
ncbi:HNH endonuclease [Lignipirellula cremea]|uniref:HNH endonuclease n=1 Tax=Lignipirellula cremea TaxID=2528010 RepID=A0A518DMF2_9BACT|nr:HNH endonuclease [Lignipirellula cremea]QDU93020.1 HNH endonuclease [Lignipirellula cremea]